MTVHTLHPDVLRYGLSPGCPRCVELAESPAQLDQAMRRRLAEGRIITPLDLFAAQRLGVGA